MSQLTPFGQQPSIRGVKGRPGISYRDEDEDQAGKEREPFGDSYENMTDNHVKTSEKRYLTLNSVNGPATDDIKVTFELRTNEFSFLSNRYQV